jgi:hypothetical protein
MKTDDLLSMLAREAEPVSTARGRTRFGAVLGAAAVASFALMAVALGVRPDLAQAAPDPMFWVKLAFPALLGVGAMLGCWRLVHPGMKLRNVAVGIAAPVLAMALLAAIVLWTSQPGERAGMIFGNSWYACPPTIAILAVPGLALMLWIAQDFAPTRPALAGAACGLAAGTFAALAYSLYCPEMQAPFIAIWYLLGMLIPAAIGAVLGARLLRW